MKNKILKTHNPHSHKILEYNKVFMVLHKFCIESRQNRGTNFDNNILTQFGIQVSEREKIRLLVNCRVEGMLILVKSEFLWYPDALHKWPLWPIMVYVCGSN